MLAVEAEMKGLARYFKEKEPVSAESYDEAQWGLAGLVHDADYEEMKDKHPSPEFFKQLEELGFGTEIIDAIKAHGWKFQPGLPEPKTKMEWSLYCCDELSGLIIACALVRPDPTSPPASEGLKRPSKLEILTLGDVLKKWPQKSFAAGVNRSQTELCEEKLGIKLDEFIKICLQALQAVSSDLEL